MGFGLRGRTQIREYSQLRSIATTDESDVVDAKSAARRGLCAYHPVSRSVGVDSSSWKDYTDSPPSSILNTYAESISRYAEVRPFSPAPSLDPTDASYGPQEKFARNEIDTILNARVKEVTPSSVIYTTKTADGKTIDHELPSGFTLWSTGIAMNPFTVKVASLLRNQYHAHALEVDAHLRVLGAPLGTVYAIGDCATIETRLVDHLLEMVRVCDENGDGVVDEREFERLMKVCQFPFFPSMRNTDEGDCRSWIASSQRLRSTSNRFEMSLSSTLTVSTYWD